MGPGQVRLGGLAQDELNRIDKTTETPPLLDTMHFHYMQTFVPRQKYGLNAT